MILKYIDKKFNVLLILFVTLGYMIFKIGVIYWVVMITEGNKYISGMLRTIGLAFLAPIGSNAFQFLVFEKSIFAGHCLVSLLVCLFGWILIFLGYTYVKENRNVK